MSWPDKSLTADETIVTIFRPHWKLLVLPTIWLILLSALWGTVIWYFDTGIWGFVVYLPFVLWFVAYPLLLWRAMLYVLTSERLMTRHGLISKSGIEIPLESITNVNFSQTVLERIIGAGDLLVESAGTSGQSRFRDIPHPDRFQTELYRIREERSLYLGGRGRVAPQIKESTKRGGVHNAEAIQRLAELHAQGHVTDEEFESKRRQLLDEM